MSKSVALQLMQSSFPRFEAIGSRLASATCNRSTTLRHSSLHLQTTGEGRRYYQLLASNGSITASRSMQKRGPYRARFSAAYLHGGSTTESDQAGKASAQLRARRMVLRHLREQNPDGLLRAFSEASTDLEYVRSLPQATFTKILRLLDPGYFVEPYKHALDDLSSADLRVLGIRPVQTFFADFIRHIQDIISKRRQAGHELDLDDYRMLLNCAGSVGDVGTADAFWDDMYKNGLKPDTLCYNHYMEAKCWSGAYEAAQRHKLRVIPHNMAMRHGNERKSGFRGYQVGNPFGLKLQIVRLFDRMIRQGLLGDEMTFVLMMTAMGREGDLKGVKVILTKVWGVDVDKIMADDEISSEAVELYPGSSPLRPTTRLLFTLAHIFGLNNDIPTALRLVDHVSRQYSLPIPRNVWSQLLGWTFVLSRKRAGPRKTDGASLGQLPLDSIASLWETMISEPYNIKPTMPMYNKYIANLNMRQMIKPTLRLMREAKSLFQDSYRAYRAALNASLAALERSRKARRQHSRARARLVQLQRQLERARMRRARDYAFLKRWVRLLLGNSRWNDMVRSWDERGIPDAIEEWRPFLPAKARYEILTGMVELDIRSTRMSTRRYLRHRRHGRKLMAWRRPVEWKVYSGVGSDHKPS